MKLEVKFRVDACPRAEDTRNNCLIFIHSVLFDEGREFDEVCFSNSFFEHNNTIQQYKVT